MVGRRRTNRETSVKVVHRSDRKHFLFRWTDRSGVPREMSSGIVATKRNRRLAERKAAELTKELARPAGVTLLDFDHRYTEQHLSGLSASSNRQWRTAVEHLYQLGAKLLSDVDSVMLSELANHLRIKGLTESSIDSYLRTIKAGLSWAAELEMIEKVPRSPRLRRARGKSKRMRGRPLTTEEFERMISAAEQVRKKDHDVWQELLTALWLSGLRIDEALRLSWDRSSDFRIDVSGKFPIYRILADGEKGHRDRQLPVVPEFADWLIARTKRKRGRALSIRKARLTCVRVVSTIGERAGVVVDADGRTASANDLRRSFAARWAIRVTPAELQQLMRHQSIETTMAYYVDLDTESFAERLQQVTTKLGGTLGGSVETAYEDEFPKT